MKIACDKGDALKKQTEVWASFDEVVPFLRGEEFTEGDAARFRIAINKFTKAFVQCWGEEHVTHYIHILYTHGPWLIKTHGSLGVWQCQGMEKSHWRARGNWQKHTAHGGGRGVKRVRGGDEADEAEAADQVEQLKYSSLYQLMAHDYRMLLHRRRKKALLSARALINKEKAKRSKKYADAWKKAYDAMDEVAKEKVKENCAKARRQKSLLLEQKHQFETKLKEDMHFLHGLVPEE